jgi:hypothetical protein
LRERADGDGPEEQERLTAVEKYLHQTEYARSLIARGEAKGEARAVLLLLDHRKVALSEEDRARIAATTDTAVLQRWIVRAPFVSSVENLFV